MNKPEGNVVVQVLGAIKVNKFNEVMRAPTFSSD